MTNEIFILSITAASIGFFHTLFGPDHYLPFIVMSKARNWSLSKTTFITFLCGIGHILSSILLGILGIALGIAVTKLEGIESVRGSIAAWLLIAFGLVYFVWGLKKAIRNKSHEHIHSHEYGTAHKHSHTHAKEHMHIHGKTNITPWILFTIFVFGPCEPLIPILMYPAAKENLIGITLVTAIFGAVTLTTMLSIVLISSFGISFMPLGKLERYSHALAGAVICISGMTIQFLGL